MHCALVFSFACSYVFTRYGRFLNVLTCFEYKSGRPIFRVFFKHAIGSRESPVVRSHQGNICINNAIKGLLQGYDQVVNAKNTTST